MYYSVLHRTRFRYDTPISESITEARMQPRGDGHQHCLRFQLTTLPQARVFEYTEFAGNVVHYFDVPGRHSQLIITAEAIVETQPAPTLPDALTSAAWLELDELVQAGDYWDYLLPGDLSRPSDRLYAFADQIDMRATHARRRDDPLSALRQINQAIYAMFDYEPKSTDVDSPIDHALEARKGVCQDFSHIMIGLVRTLGIPCRYVSGYLYHAREVTDRRAAPDATHAWVEALLPGLGWVGFDPTNNTLADERHIRVAVGREYGDVPPTRGIHKGVAKEKLTVDVRVQKIDAPPEVRELPPPPPTAWIVEAMALDAQHQQEQQQQ